MSLQKELILSIEKRCEQQQIEYESKIELLKQKILSRFNNQDNQGNDNDQAGQEFMELLNLCRSDLSEILDKLRQKILKDAVVEDQLRSELIEQGRKMNELRVSHEEAIYQQQQEISAKFESELQRADAEFKKLISKIMEELSQKDTKIRQFEKNEKKNMVEKEKVTNLEAKVKLLNE